MKPVICATITAADEQQYHAQIEKVAGFAHRIQIDLTDGEFAPGPLIEPSDAWWPAVLKADFHLMYKQPLEATKAVVKHSPHLVIVHVEAAGSFTQIQQICHSSNVRVGLALLPATPAKEIFDVLDHIDHVLIFSGNLGHQGGSYADLALLDKVAEIKRLKPGLEVGWDGGINDQNVSALVAGGVDVLNVGAYIQDSAEPQRAFNILERIADETGTT